MKQQEDVSVCQPANKTSFYLNNPLVIQAWSTQDNFLIEDERRGVDGCTFVYFSSHAIYFPDTEAAFRQSILSRNRFEYWRLRAPGAVRHVFVRDVLKQWYIRGINRNIDSLEKVIGWLAELADGGEVIAVGSSAGGYAAIVCGCLLGAKAVFAFSPQMDLAAACRRRHGRDMDLVEEHMNVPGVGRYFNATAIARRCRQVPVFYFGNTGSAGDKYDRELAARVDNVHQFLFSGRTHGIPFPASLVPVVLKQDVEVLKAMALKQSSWGAHSFGYRLLGLRYSRVMLERVLAPAWRRRYRVAARARKFLGIPTGPLS